MTIRTVLSILSVNQCEEDLKSAIDFCGAQGAHLNALVIALRAVPIMADYNTISSVWLDERQREIDALSEKADEIKEILGRSGLSYEVQDVYSEFAYADADIAERALYADIVLIGREAARDEELRKRIIGGALFQTPTPILINRGRRAMNSSPGSILLAWDSSDEASRAARQSLDLLKQADTVYVTMVDPVARMGANGEEPGADIAAYLARHGVKVQVDRIASGGRPADEILRQHAIDVSADLMVMGAYNHPRWQQTIFGGVTRNMLEESKMPIFMAH
ncbi:nucleotide-binding universal stress UspA family protein [Rhizobium binae]|uniref:Nucleotide-binding universal stress UspA family protein n=4 Tax=Rhizobium binae TaxID=1138190 RepID=A0ABV2MP36_9HYPH|nr:universal stress protein [Rhizobium binae]NKL52916.1 universal stress protein [Rhizobium leguminosarum bv. viciae]MBX4948503.1 universal stress protein [Rhizobium binae]MBX4994349.1 universal stress protein [Rhizobium binae]MBX4995349.1 universal stress protein [Rhizobium binae]QSY84562.1 universal stress protein [Rhizobium binae]